MAKIWKAVGIIAAIAIIFGVLCFLVGYITGGSIGRVTDIFNSTYDVEAIRAAVQDAIQKALGI